MSHVSALNGLTAAEARSKIHDFLDRATNHSTEALAKYPDEVFLRRAGVARLKSGDLKHIHVYRVGNGEKCSVKEIKLTGSSHEIQEGEYTIQDKDRVQSADGCFYLKLGSAILRHIDTAPGDYGDKKSDAVSSAADAIDQEPVPVASEPQANKSSVSQGVDEELDKVIRMMEKYDSDPRVVPVLRVLNTVARTGTRYI